MSANQQLIDFHLGRIMQSKKKAKMQKDGGLDTQSNKNIRKVQTLKEKEQNTHLSQELGTQLKTIKEEYMQEDLGVSTIFEQRGPRPNWITKQPVLDSR